MNIAGNFLLGLVASVAAACSPLLDVCDPPIADADYDCDGDGYNNAIEQDCNTDPLSSESIPYDRDFDTVCDHQDSDDDNDGRSDELEGGRDSDSDGTVDSLDWQGQKQYPGYCQKIYPAAGSDERLVVRRSYDEQGRIRSSAFTYYLITEMRYESDALHPLAALSYDSEGNITNEQVYEFLDLGRARTRNNTVVETHEYVENNIRFSRKTFALDATGIANTFEYDSGADGTIDATASIEYSDGAVVKIISYDTGDKRRSGITEFEYDSTANLTKVSGLSPGEITHIQFDFAYRNDQWLSRATLQGAYPGYGGGSSTLLEFAEWAEFSFDAMVWDLQGAPAAERDFSLWPLRNDSGMEENLVAYDRCLERLPFYSISHAYEHQRDNHGNVLKVRVIDREACNALDPAPAYEIEYDYGCWTTSTTGY